MKLDKLDANKLVKDITVEVDLKGLQVLRVRLFVGSLFFRMAAFIVGCDLSIKNQEKTDV